MPLTTTHLITQKYVRRAAASWPAGVLRWVVVRGIGGPSFRVRVRLRIRVRVRVRLSVRVAVMVWVRG
jgi:hypothetical protein